MSFNNPEFSRRVAAGRVGIHGLDMKVAATEAECRALAKRFGLPAILSLTCQFRLTEVPGHTIQGEGRLHARVVQNCVVTLDEFTEQVRENFTVRFMPVSRIVSGQHEDPDSPDVIPFEGDSLDLGEAAAEQLGLILEPYPRRPGAKLPAEACSDEELPVEVESVQEERRRPFEVLSGLVPKK
ncbi:MAG: DUF177 domain-containing protein [Acetobacter sp.]|nr:DUF177 domain-containing protein [Acetobacter sp.]